jgi:hypothetical protein
VDEGILKTVLILSLQYNRRRGFPPLPNVVRACGIQTRNSQIAAMPRCLLAIGVLSELLSPSGTIMASLSELLPPSGTIAALSDHFTPSRAIVALRNYNGLPQ